MAGDSPLRGWHCPMGQVPQELKGEPGNWIQNSGGGAALPAGARGRGVMRLVMEVLGKW